MLRIWWNSWKKKGEQISNWAHIKSGLNAKNLFCSYKSVPVSNPCFLTDCGFVLHLLHTSFEVHFLTHKGIYLPLKKRNQITERIKFLSECSYILQFGITFKDIWHFWILLYVSHFSDDKDSDGKEKKSKSKEKDKDKKKEPASMFQINGEKDSKSKKKGDW